MKVSRKPRVRRDELRAATNGLMRAIVDGNRRLSLALQEVYRMAREERQQGMR